MEAAVHAPMPMLDVSIWDCAGCTVVELTGELDVFSVRGLRQDLAALPLRLVVFDLSALEFCDSSGLGLMVGTFKRLRDTGGGLVLVGVREHLNKVLRITGLHTKVLQTAASLEEAAAVLAEAHAR